MSLSLQPELTDLILALFVSLSRFPGKRTNKTTLHFSFFLPICILPHRQVPGLLQSLPLKGGPASTLSPEKALPTRLLERLLYCEKALLLPAFTLLRAAFTSHETPWSGLPGAPALVASSLELHIHRDNSL